MLNEFDRILSLRFLWYRELTPNSRFQSIHGRCYNRCMFFALCPHHMLYIFRAMLRHREPDLHRSRQAIW